MTNLSKTCELSGKNGTERQEIIVGWNKLEAQQVISFQFWSEVWVQHCYFTMEYWILLLRKIWNIHQDCDVFLPCGILSPPQNISKSHCDLWPPYTWEEQRSWRSWWSRESRILKIFLTRRANKSAVCCLLCMFFVGRKSLIVRLIGGVCRGRYFLTTSANKILGILQSQNKTFRVECRKKTLKFRKREWSFKWLKYF